jgi:protein involved in polysaccharide export with SLBB domain
VWKFFQITAFTLCIVFPVRGQTPPATVDDTYRLGPDDKLHIRVPALRNFVGEPQPEATALNDEFTVNPDGRLSLPLIGSVPAAGKTTEAVADAIANRLQTAVGMDRPPKISVEIAHFRPFYIVGAVNHPGEYPYRPGITVLQALGIAGGLFRPIQSDTAQSPGGSQQADLRLLLLQSNRLIARRARLQAELDGVNEVKFPPELTRRGSDPEIAAVLKREEAAFEAHNHLKDLLNKEMTSLQQKIASVDQELGMVQDELTKVAGLAAKGWVPAPQEITLRQNVMGMQRNRLDLDTAILRAKEEIDKQNQGVLGELDEAAAKFSEVSAKIATIAGVLRHDEATMLELAASRPDEATVVYAILRREESGVQEIAASEMTLVQPGDTIRVTQQVMTSSAPPPEVAPASPPAAEPQPKSPLQPQRGRVSLATPVRPTILSSGSATQPIAGGATASVQKHPIEASGGAGLGGLSDWEGAKRSTLPTSSVESSVEGTSAKPVAAAPVSSRAAESQQPSGPTSLVIPARGPIVPSAPASELATPTLSGAYPVGLMPNDTVFVSSDFGSAWRFYEPAGDAHGGHAASFGALGLSSVDCASDPRVTRSMGAIGFRHEEVDEESNWHLCRLENLLFLN